MATLSTCLRLMEASGGYNYNRMLKSLDVEPNHVHEIISAVKIGPEPEEDKLVYVLILGVLAGRSEQNNINQGGST